METVTDFFATMRPDDINRNHLGRSAAAAVAPVQTTATCGMSEKKKPPSRLLALVKRWFGLNQLPA